MPLSFSLQRGFNSFCVLLGMHAQAHLLLKQTPLLISPTCLLFSPTCQLLERPLKPLNFSSCAMAGVW